MGVLRDMTQLAGGNRGYGYPGDYQSLSPSRRFSTLTPLRTLCASSVFVLKKPSAYQRLALTRSPCSSHMQQRLHRPSNQFLWRRLVIDEPVLLQSLHRCDHSPRKLLR